MLREGRLAQLISGLLRWRPWIDWRNDLVEYGMRPLLPRTWRHAYRHWRPARPHWADLGLAPDLLARTHLAERDAHDQRWRELYRPGQWERYRDLTESVVPPNLAVIMDLCNRHGLEHCEPFRDRRLVEFAMAIPADQLDRPSPWRTKWLLRQALADRWPEAIARRQGKTSFTDLFLHALVAERATVQALLADPQIVQRGFIEAKRLRELLAVPLVPSRSLQLLWRCLCLELWLARYW
jgi:hypothetical protein